MKSLSLDTFATFQNVTSEAAGLSVGDNKYRCSIVINGKDT